MNWLNPDKTLREQDVSVGTVVNLRKRLFFPEQDKTVDRGTPVLLNTIYDEVRQVVILLPALFIHSLDTNVV